MKPRLLLILAASTLLAGCKTVGPDFAAPAPPSENAGYASTGAGKAELGQGPERQWWKAFGSLELDALVDRALKNNHSIAASRATLEHARERINAIRGRQQPQADARARAEYQQINLDSIGLSVPNAPSAFPRHPNFDLYTLGAGVTYNLDLWGGTRRAVEQAAAEAEAQQRQTEAAHLLIAGRVTQQVLAIAALNDRIATERVLLTEDQRNLELTQSRFKGGVGTMVEVLSAEGQLASDRANLPPLEQQLAEGRAMLAVLLGVSPAELGPTDFTLDRMTLPGSVPVAIPSALVRKRPDILEAEAQLHAATAAIGVAAARLYPDVTIGATLTQTTSRPEKLFDWASNGFDIFGNLTAPLFHGGTLKAQKREAEAAARAAASNYQQVVLEAFGQVSGLLSALETDQASLDTQSRSAEVAGRSLYLSRRSFQVGNSGILQVLDASRAYQRAKIAFLAARSHQYLNVARLHAATAGGWMEEPSKAVAANAPAP